MLTELQIKAIADFHFEKYRKTRGTQISWLTFYDAFKIGFGYGMDVLELKPPKEKPCTSLPSQQSFKS